MVVLQWTALYGICNILSTPIPLMEYLSISVPNESISVNAWISFTDMLHTRVL